VLPAVAERVAELAASYSPPAFAEVPGPDPALFLCAIDHRTGYRGRYLVGGRGPFEGSDLLWHVGIRAELRRPRALSAAALAGVGAERVATMLKIGGETVAGPEVRAVLWSDLAAGLLRDYDGSAEVLCSSAEGMLGGAGGLIDRLAGHEAFADPLRKKAFLFAKIADRRGWIDVEDPESWEVCADNVLMRLALRSGLVHPGPVERVRTVTREAFKRVAAEVGIPVPLLDDLLWERGREDPDLLGTAGGDVAEPPRPDGTTWY
jgi:hypothetical protein